MNKPCFCGIVLAALAWPFAPAPAQVLAENARVVLEGEIQVVWDSVQEDRGNGQAKIEDLQVRHPEFLLAGEVGRYAGFSLRSEFAPDAAGAVPLTLLDARADLHPHSAVTLSFGRFTPRFTLFLNERASRLDTINYPLIVEPTVAPFYPGRQTGAELVLHFGGGVDLHAGVFNGRDRPDNFNDNNTSKDFVLSLDARLRENVRLVGGYYTGQFHVEGQSVGPNQTVILPFGQTFTNPTGQAINLDGFDLRHESVALGAAANLAGDRVRLRAEYLNDRAEDQGNTQVQSVGYYLHLGLVPLRGVEVLGRYELLDPDVGTADNELIWVTTGGNIDLTDHARLGVNYIFKKETGADIQDGGNQSHNDEFLAAVTAWW